MSRVERRMGTSRSTHNKAVHNKKLGDAVGSAKNAREQIRTDYEDFGQRLITPGEYDHVLWPEGKP